MWYNPLFKNENGDTFELIKSKGKRKKEATVKEIYTIIRKKQIKLWGQINRSYLTNYSIN